MQITLVRTGGYTGMPLTVTVNTSTLSADEANYLYQLIEKADFFHLAGITEASVQPDRFEYEITVESSDRSHTVTYAESAVPESLRSLLKWLLAQQNQRKRS